MKVVVAYPPNRAEIEAVLGVAPHTAIYAWGDSIYNPSGADLPDHLIVHERTHSRQQEAVGGPEPWWRLYLLDATFRLEQEVEAYRAQLASVQGAVRSKLLPVLAMHLASPMYGSIVSFGSAIRLLTGKAA